MTFTEFETKHPDLLKHFRPSTLRSYKKRDHVPDTTIVKALQSVAKGEIVANQGVANIKIPLAAKNSALQSVATPVANLLAVAEDLPELTPEYCAKFGYIVGQPHDWETIKAIFEAARRLRAKRTNPTDLLTVVEPSAEPGHPEWDFMSDGYARGFPGDSVRMRAEFRTPAALRRVAERDGLDFKELLRSRGYETLDSTAETPKSPPQPHPKNPKCSCAKCKEWRNNHVFKGGSK